ncbi:MAG: hypothetical protein COV60_02400 [Candidatus Magasanikbacteria bacterium CG11_big_fil_rev_8_21_14_0_20_43_7]|uniref:SUF system FeS cluster assembly SufBD core domain-containing protein n=1 Tax=Candidatus Magasanikbacteria bacterium CG11_big_fil_rev_8_21_14_0_20_43_7 TaxID=1974654 RepID=A0A2H0N4J7_9BACT|nr:MAG: hypothetical protein COV60_02400 [Candidatus Magasanikbacteria bacterium CG11_big_fil_rev_8_21_14_0_20_43_7]
MSSIQTEHLKYGIGISTDYTELGLNTRKITAGSVDCTGDRIELNIPETEVGITDHQLFSFIAENKKDTFNIKTSEDIHLTINAITKTGLVYIQIFVEKHASITIHEQLIPKDFLGCIIDIIIEENANVTYIADQRIAEHQSVITLRRAFVKYNAHMKWIDLAIGGTIANSSIYTMLDEPKAVGETYGLFFGTGSQLHDIAHTTIHRAPSTTSNLRTNGALDDSAKAVYRSLIDIRKNAPDAKGHQKEETLLLSRDAQISSVPDLEISNNEVSCSHGVSTTNIDDRLLFYFHSRGVGTAEAKQAIVDGHFGVILDMIEDESIKLRVADALKQSI